MKQKILFIQTPLLDHGYSYVAGNVNYGPASIAAFLTTHYKTKVAIEYLPWIYENYGSNDIIVAYVISSNPAIVCFTAYLWNVERALFLAKQIKKSNNRIKIFMGGPEINPGSWVLSECRPEVDLFIVGEGEWFFDNYLIRNLEKFRQVINGNNVVLQPHNSNISIGRLVEPLTNRYLDIMPDGSSFIELVRGCPYKCAYCLYSKNCQGIREYPFSTLINAIKMNSWMNIQELYILAPTFNRMSKISEKLKLLAELKHTIKLHTEMRTDGIQQNHADLLYAAGFRSLEVGIQTLNENALGRINRKSNTESELEGMKNLKNSGISLNIGMIAGLPGDSKKEFINSISRMCELGYSENIELYYLMMLPGTKIREMAIAEGVSFQKKPPYYFLEGWGISYEDILEIIDYTDNMRGYTNTIDYLPDFTYENKGMLIGSVFLDVSKYGVFEKRKLDRIIQTSVFTIHLINGSESKVIETILSIRKEVQKNHQLYNVIIYLNNTLGEKNLSEAIAKEGEQSLLFRMNIFHDSRTDKDIRIYQVIDNYDIYIKASKAYSLITPIFRVNTKNSTMIERLVKNMNKDDINVLIDSGIYYEIENYIIDEFREFPEKIVFKSENEKKRFYAKIDYPFVEWPSLFYTIEM
jgi:radical SAM superfamily enzyme YgiQ (UPF0313 family)